MGGSIFWKTREIGLPSYSKICTVALIHFRKNGSTFVNMDIGYTSSLTQGACATVQVLSFLWNRKGSGNGIWQFIVVLNKRPDIIVK
jgi:hypothetical protein